MKKKQIYIPTLPAIAIALSTAVVQIPTASAASNVEAIKVLDNVVPRVPNTRFGGIAYNGDFYIFYTQDLQAYKSDDGLNWDIVESSFHSTNPNHYDGEVKKIIWDGKQFVMLREYSIYTSRDGVNWDDKGNIGKPQPTSSYPDTNQQYDFQDIIYANNHYIIVANDTNTPDYSSGEPQMILTYKNSFFVSADLKTFQKATSKNMVVGGFGGERPMNDLAWI